MNDLAYAILSFTLAAGGNYLLYRLTKRKMYVIVLALYVNLIGLTGLLALFVKLKFSI